VGSRMAELLSDVPDRAACEQVVEAHLPEIAETAQAVVREAGYEYEVHAAIEETDFPSKTYGKFTFPAGKYEALRVVIGEGEGHNWWCGHVSEYVLRWKHGMRSWMRALGRN